ncbi:nitroreductase family protein [Paraburkholderia dipogonis]
MDDFESIRLLQTRPSVRRYLPKRIPTSQILKLIEVATTAPSAHNRQPWRFRLVPSEQEKNKLAMSMGARLRSDRMADGDAPETVAADVSRSYDRITGAPAVVIVCTSLVHMDNYPDAVRTDAERLMAIMGTAMAVQNFLVAAHAVGLGAYWMRAPLFCPELVSIVLKLPPDWEPLALLTVGYPANGGTPKKRRPLSEVVRLE